MCIRDRYMGLKIKGNESCEEERGKASNWEKFEKLRSQIKEDITHLDQRLEKLGKIKLKAKEQSKEKSNVQILKKKSNSPQENIRMVTPTMNGQNAKSPNIHRKGSRSPPVDSTRIKEMKIKHRLSENPEAKIFAKRASNANKKGMEIFRNDLHLDHSSLVYQPIIPISFVKRKDEFSNEEITPNTSSSNRHLKLFSRESRTNDILINNSNSTSFLHKASKNDALSSNAFQNLGIKLSHYRV
eukprot:TRINITY_DN18020_c0_g1_i1.p1 TRINITY_DN18020_c0_g1~~TRINITY_DN18020_c0_g1_i1.p1  ORF type:complete len:261 (+),score=48.49 TRINITY_DN18020_c0_g1_i1:60-785(+)